MSSLIHVDRISLHYTTLCTEHSIIFHGFHVSLKRVNPNRPGDCLVCGLACELGTLWGNGHTLSIQNKAG